MFNNEDIEIKSEKSRVSAASKRDNYIIVYDPSNNYKYRILAKMHTLLIEKFDTRELAELRINQYVNKLNKIKGTLRKIELFENNYAN